MGKLGHVNYQTDITNLKNKRILMRHDEAPINGYREIGTQYIEQFLYRFNDDEKHVVDDALYLRRLARMVITNAGERIPTDKIIKLEGILSEFISKIDAFEQQNK